MMCKDMNNVEKPLQNHQKKLIIWLVGISVFLLECAAGYYYNVYVEYYHSDGISRVANAFYVLYSQHPHLGAIGFVWNPLPSLIDTFFLFFYPWVPELATKGIAGVLMSAIFAALTTGIMVKAFLQRGLPYWIAIIFSLLFSLNPMIFLFGFNGMSDAPFIFFIIASIISFLNWLDGRRLGDLAVSAFALALSFWCRYEAVPFGFSLIVGCVMAVMLVQKQQHPPNESRIRYQWSKTEGVLSVVASPLIYSVILWLLLNAIIMGNPLNFMNGEYTNVAQIAGHLNDPVYAAMLSDPLAALLFALQKTIFFSSPLIAILLLRLINGRFFRWDTVILLGMFISVPLLQVLMLIKGSSLGWLRYFIYVLPISVAWLPYELSKIKHKWQVLIPLLAMVLNFALLSYAITQPNLAPDENTFLRNSFGNHTQAYYQQQDEQKIAAYLDENYTGSTILTDSFSAYFIILQSQYPKHFYISSDPDFKHAISDPQKYGVEYVLIPKPGSASVISAINNAYPNLYEQGADWAELVKDFGSDWRLYKITRSTEGGPS